MPESEREVFESLLESWGDLIEELTPDEGASQHGMQEWRERYAAASQPLREALELIARDGCENYTGHHRCYHPSNHRVRGAPYTADSWCHPCVAQHALDHVTEARS